MSDKKIEEARELIDMATKLQSMYACRYSSAANILIDKIVVRVDELLFSKKDPE